MEHRCGVRVSVNLKVLIYKRGLLVAVGRLRNFGRRGLYVTTDYGDVAINQPLEIEVLGDSAGRDSHRRCRAVVVHKTPEGFGLDLNDSCAVSCGLVNELLAIHSPRHKVFLASHRRATAAAVQWSRR